MICPFCNSEMESGYIINDDTYLKWSADNKKLNAMEYLFSTKGVMEPTIDKFKYSLYKGFYCGKCKKIIMDADPS